MKILAEIIYDGERLDDQGDPVVEREQCYVLHFGLTYQMVDNGYGYSVPVNYTIAVVQEVKTGNIRSVLPDCLRIIGEDVTKLRV